MSMTNIESIERDIESLDDKAFTELRASFIEYDHARWERQIEVDSKAGKLDELIDEALAEHGSGKPTPLSSTRRLRDSGRSIGRFLPIFASVQARVIGYSRRTPRILPRTSRNWIVCGRRALGFIIGLLPSRSTVGFFGSGSAPMQSTTSRSAVEPIGLNALLKIPAENLAK